MMKGRKSLVASRKKIAHRLVRGWLGFTPWFDSTKQISPLRG